MTLPIIQGLITGTKNITKNVVTRKMRDPISFDCLKTIREVIMSPECAPYNKTVPWACLWISLGELLSNAT
jgi:hypothetical protein